MAKEIHNPVEVVLKFTHDEEWTVSGWARYNIVETEYPGIVSCDKVLDLVFTQAQKSAIVQFASSVIYPQISAKEGM